MDFKALLEFLRELDQNNSKEWMDKHRKTYHRHRDSFIHWLNQLNIRLGQVDPDYYPTSGKTAINRINNNLMFHPNKPVYKDHFGAGLDKAPNSGDFYIQIGIRQSLLAGGLWRPEPKRLRSVREAIDYNGEAFMEILDKPSFKKLFGSLYEDEKLLTAPKGYSKDHPYIDLLRNKTFAVEHQLTEDIITDPDFDEYIVVVYQEMIPFRRYLNKAITV
ncbi:DUF2461 domain-containing protein [Muriicola soli]|uniref:DUF2461 domain-containing protein n=1 Tax=Muriicola soli TaxID=2507538 RepID=A0A411EDE6_9FLAO|nr:DUF2461 domain-containing protein [Muriicola soli]QBA65636.1 DUF2461 domain-containing protein [Muriicola soli]